MNDKPTSLSDTRFDRLVTMLISSVAILVAVTAFMQNQASNLSEQSLRRAQELAIHSTTRRVTGAIQFSYEWQSAYQTWYEVGLQVTAAQQAGDTAAEERYRQLQERLAAASVLLGDPYYDSRLGPLTRQYESDIYLVESTRLAEMYTAESALGRAWSDAADRFVIQITLLTVALSLYGLSLTLKGGVRWLFVIVGSGIVGICALWLGVELLLPKPAVSEPAIEAFARGVGLDYVDKEAEAIAAFDEAVAIQPDYANAFYERGNAYYQLGDYERTIADYEAARLAGRDDVNVRWNLGWTYYLLGRYDEAIAVNRQVLDGNPGVLGVRMNQGLTMLAKGDLQAAQAEYDLLIQEAARQVADARSLGQQPPSSLWYYLDAGAADLQNLIDQLDGNIKYWTLAPEVAHITGDHAPIKVFAFEQMTRIKETALALEYAGQVPPLQDVMSVSPLVFGTITETDEQGYVVTFEEAPDGVFPAYTPYINIQFSYTGPIPSQQIMWKVLHDGIEDTSFRAAWDPDLSSSDTWYTRIGFDYTDTFVLSPGEYTVELYVDYQLVQTGTFYVLSE